MDEESNKKLDDLMSMLDPKNINSLITTTKGYSDKDEKYVLNFSV